MLIARSPGLFAASNLHATINLSSSLAVLATTSDFQILCHGVSLCAWSRPRIFLGRLQARVRDLFSPATTFGLQYRRCGSCHTLVFTWRPYISGLRSSDTVTAQCHLVAISVLILATPEDISAPAAIASITLITASWSWVLALSTTLILA